MIDAIPTGSHAWTFLSNHAHALICLADDEDCRVRDLAERIGITERATQRILADLEAGGYLVRERRGRRSHTAWSSTGPCGIRWSRRTRSATSWRRSPDSRPADPHRGEETSTAGADLVEERKRARIALQRLAHEPAHQRLHLVLDHGRQAQRGDRLDVQAPICTQHLEGVDR